jgi:hypothetical protein
VHDESDISLPFIKIKDKNNENVSKIEEKDKSGELEIEDEEEIGKE